MEKSKAVFSHIRSWYIIYFGIILIAKEIGPYDFLPEIINNLFVWPAALIGLIFIAYDLIQPVRYKKKIDYNIFLLLFIGVMCVTTIINRQYGLFANIKLIMNEAIYFFVIYRFGQTQTNAMLTIQRFVKILIGLWLIFVTISLGMFLTQTKYSFTLKNRFHPLRLGFLENRLFGVFSDPNFASTISLIVIIMSLYYLFAIKIKISIKVFLAINVFFQLLFILLSGSRTGMIELTIGLAFFLFIYCYTTNLMHIKNSKANFFSSLLLSLFISVTVYFLLEILKDFIAMMYTHLIQITHKQGGKAKNVTLIRNDVSDDSANELSNGRIEMWKNAIEIFRQNWLIGVGPSREGIVAYSKKFFPTNVLARTGMTIHSCFFHALAGTGLLGTLSFFIFIIQKAFSTIKYSLVIKNPINNIYFYFILCILAVSINAFLAPEIILVNKIGAFIFWLFLGSLTTKFKKKI